MEDAGTTRTVLVLLQAEDEDPTRVSTRVLLQADDRAALADEVVEQRSVLAEDLVQVPARRRA